MPTNISDTFAAAGTYPTAEGPLQHRSYATSGLPAASSLPAGTTVWDSTVLALKITDGSNWNLVGAGTVTSVGLSLPNIFTVSGSPVISSGTLTGSLASQSQNLVFASPNGSSGTPTFRALVAADLPSGSIVNSVSNSDSSLTISPTTGAVVASLNVGNANTWTAAQTFNAAVTVGGALDWNTTTVTSTGTTTITASEVIVFVNASGTPTIKLPASPVAGEYHIIEDASGSCANGNTITVDGNGHNVDASSTKTITRNYGRIGVIYNSTAGIWQVTVSKFVGSVLSAGTAQTDRTGLNFGSEFTLTDSGSNDRTTVDIATGGVTNAMLANSSITINAPSYMSSWGAVSLGGSLSPTWSSQSQNLVFVSPNGSSGAPTFRALVAADLPGGSIANTVSNSDGTLTISPTSGAVVASLALGHANTWTAIQTFAPTNTSSYAAVVAPVAASSGTQGSLSVTAPASTSQTASTEINAVLLDCSATRTWSSGALTTQREVLIKAPTYNIGANTLTTAATLAISAAPTAGGSTTITNAYALWVQAGTARLDGGVTTSSVVAPSSTALTLTGAAASTWSTSSGALTVSGSGGINLQQGGTTYWDLGVTTSHVLTNTVTSIGTAQTVGESLYNSTAAAAGAQQYSPMIEFVGQGWKTATTAASQTVKAAIQLQPVQGASNPTYNLVFMDSVNGASYGGNLSFTNLSASPKLISGATLSGSGTGYTLDTSNAWTSGDRLVSFRSNTTEYLSIQNHSGFPTINSPSGCYFQVGSNSRIVNSSTSWSPETDKTMTLGVSGQKWQQIWAYQHLGVVQTVAAATSITIDPTAGEFIRITLSSTAITSLTISAGQADQYITVEVIQDSGGSKSIPTTWTNVRFAGGSYTASTGGNAVDTITFVYNTSSSKWDETGRAVNLS